MRLYPAIDLKDGKCVRLRQGAFSDITVYSDRPWEMAARWEQAGAGFLHLVDLDGARSGRGVNRDVIRKIAETVRIPIQLGGGIRTEEDIQEVLGLGVFRVIIGTKAVERPEFLREMVNRFGSQRIVAGIDAKDGMAAVDGWEKASGMPALDLGKLVAEMGVRSILNTDISKDGMLSGPNVEATRILSEASGADVIASGGVSCMEDLRNVAKAGIHGTIIGKALYEGRIDLKEAAEEFEGGGHE